MNTACVGSRFPLLFRRFSRQIRDAIPPEKVGCDDPVGADFSVHFRWDLAFSPVHGWSITAQHARVWHPSTIRSSTVFDQSFFRCEMPRVWNDHIVGSHRARSIAISVQVEYRRDPASGVSDHRGSLGSALGNSRPLALATAEGPVGRRAHPWHPADHAQRLGRASLGRLDLNRPRHLGFDAKKKDDYQALFVSSLLVGRS